MIETKQLEVIRRRIAAGDTNELRKYNATS
jgi:hypothetical protein